MRRKRDIAGIGPARRPATGFTLAELLVATGIIVLALGIVVPTLHGIFTAPTDKEAEGTLGAMLSLTRGVAIESQGYALLHGQMGVDGEYWVAAFSYDHAKKMFVPAPGCIPKQIDGHMGFGEVSSRFVSGSDYGAALDTPGGWLEFTTFNVIFASDGSLVTTLVPEFDTSHEIFTGGAKVKVWSVGGVTLNETGVRAMTVFDHKLLKLKPDRSAYLNENGRFVVINAYTGQLMDNDE